MAKCTYHHLQGPTGLSEALETICSSLDSSARPIVVFDFDRTLTNGFASPDPTLGIEKRIRGGATTLASLIKAKTLGVEMFVITARSATKLTIEQLEASMRKCQVELASIFMDLKVDDEFHVEKVNGRPLAWRGRLFASEYAKPIALMQILQELKGEDTLVVHFFDDYVMNAFDIGVGDYGPRVVSLTTYWWDTFIEESSGMIGMVNSFSSDFPYQKGCEAALAMFGIDENMLAERRQYYLDYELKNNIKPKPKEELPEPVKVNESVKANLGGLLAGRAFRPPPSSN